MLDFNLGLGNIKGLIEYLFVHVNEPIMSNKQIIIVMKGSKVFNKVSFIKK